MARQRQKTTHQVAPRRNHPNSLRARLVPNGVVCEVCGARVYVTLPPSTSRPTPSLGRPSCECSRTRPKRLPSRPGVVSAFLADEAWKLADQCITPKEGGRR